MADLGSNLTSGHFVPKSEADPGFTVGSRDRCMPTFDADTFLMADPHIKFSDTLPLPTVPKFFPIWGRGNKIVS